MDDVTFELPLEQVRDLASILDWGDIAYGYRRGFIDATTVVSLAVEKVTAGEEGATAELAALLSDELDRVPELLKLAAAGASSEEISSRIWMFLILRAVWREKERFRRPLLVVEAVYEQFDHPPEIAHLIYYVPPDDGIPKGEQALLERLGAFVEDEEQRLRSSRGGP